MKAAICAAFGAIDSLSIRDREPGRLHPGHVRIDVHAAGVNFPDGLIVQGKYQTLPEPPFTPGSEVAGVIRELGHGVDDFECGVRVVAFCGSGGYAEQVDVPASQVYRLPDNVEAAAAAAMLITYGTSYHGLKDRAVLRPGETLLILGAAGGVGLAAVQLGTVMGARVIAAASTPEKLALTQHFGATEFIDYSKEDLRERVKALTDGKGVDVVYDPVGGDMSLAAVKSLAWGGRQLVVGFAGGRIPAIPANLLLLKSAASLGVLWGNSLRADPEHHACNVRDLLWWLAEGQIRPFIDATYPLEQATAALAEVMERRAKGKVVLEIRKNWGEAEL